MATIRTFLFLFFGFLIVFGYATWNETIESIALQEGRNNTFLIAKHRKPVNPVRVEEPNRIWGGKCSKEDIVISQSPTRPLPNGIPTYTVEIMNNCFSGCKISHIHLSCGWFSSTNVINPKVFRRLSYDDCFVNNGKPLEYGSVVSFRYANSFSYPLYVKTITCV
ncbi:unnamed protein product [Lupinus luteus]|uniref:Protein TAPETUM DETERMINANT 1 n=1 Tax=Lupinus luteus TaxID=3873 RepID=A0AAV1XAS3_LUPLU